jgi:amino acid adenylation domain-containing protein
VRELLQDWVTLHAEIRPDALAVAGAGEALTYARLEGFSSRLARILRVTGCKKGDRVCLLMPKSATAIACIVGIYKADCIYVPLDTSCPSSRLAKMIASSGSTWILAGGPVTSLLDEIFEDERFRKSISVGWLDADPVEGMNFRASFTLDDVRRYPPAPPDYRNTAQDAAHILFTSGSTGTPKGVVITHSNVIHFVKWATRYFRMTSADRVSAHTPLHFDLSVFDIFGTFAVGAQLHLVPPELNLVPNKLAQFIRDSNLTQWFSVPAILNYMAKFDVVKPNDFPALRRLLWCGEVFPTPSLIYWMQRLPHVRFTNLYGPTETTIASSYYTVPECPENEKASIPIGTACDGEELLLLDEALRPVPIGEAGNLYIRGAGLSPGYWGDPEKTRGAFLNNPHSSNTSERIYKTGDLAKIGRDDLVYFLGRADSQIKSRGYRIELGEIETAANALKCLRESAVVAINTDGFEGSIICCAYVPAQDTPVAPPNLRKELSKVLPGYMLPGRWMSFGALPKNANGKIDRRKIKEEFERHEFETDRQSRAS